VLDIVNARRTSTWIKIPENVRNALAFAVAVLAPARPSVTLTIAAGQLKLVMTAKVVHAQLT